MGMISLVTKWNLKNKLKEWTDFVHASANSGKLKVDDSWMSVTKICCMLKINFVVGADFLHADNDAIILG